MIASSAGRDEVVKLLLELEADVNLANTNGLTCLHYAASKNHHAVGAFGTSIFAVANVWEY